MGSFFSLSLLDQFLLVGAIVVVAVGTIVARVRANINVRRAGDVTSALDYEKMKRAGLVSEEELKLVKQKMVGQLGRKIDQMNRPAVPAPKAEAALRELDMRVEVDGVAALAEGEVSEDRRRVVDREIDLAAAPPAPIDRERLTPEEEERLARMAREQGLIDEEWERRERIARERGARDRIVARAAPPAAAPAAPSPASATRAAKSAANERDIAVGAPEAVEAKNETADFFADPLAAPRPASGRLDIDAMLAAGVIDQAEYDKMKAYYDK